MNTPIPPDHRDDDPTPPSDEVRAGEFALGVLAGDERQRAQARIDADPAFARLVAAWDERFSAWLLQVAPVAPAAHVWPRVRTRLGWPAVERRRDGFWHDAGVWRGLTALATAAAIAAVVVAPRLAPDPLPPPAPLPAPAPPPVADATRPVTVLARDDGSTAWIAAIDATAGTVSMVPVPSPADAEGRVNELWVIPAGRSPISLGLVSHTDAHTIALDDTARRALAVGATLAVTLEPEAGIPHAAPTGPIVAAGGIERI